MPVAGRRAPSWEASPQPTNPVFFNTPLPQWCQTPARSPAPAVDTEICASAGFVPPPEHAPSSDALSELEAEWGRKQGYALEQLANLREHVQSSKQRRRGGSAAGEANVDASHGILAQASGHLEALTQKLGRGDVRGAELQLAALLSCLRRGAVAIELEAR